MSDRALAIVEATAVPAATPKQMIEGATDQAKVLAEVIEKQKLYSVISGRKYVRVEGWVPLARFNGVIPREVSNEAKEDGRYVARVQLVKLDDGTVLTEASAECGGPDEQLWQKRAPYARRSMAATRATGKACRLAFSWIMVLSGFEPTPAEEMDGVPRETEHQDPKAEKPQDFDLVKFADNEQASISNFKGATNLWVILNGVFSKEWAQGKGFKASKNPVKWFRAYDPAIAKECRAMIDAANKEPLPF